MRQTDLEGRRNGQDGRRWCAGIDESDGTDKSHVTRFTGSAQVTGVGRNERQTSSDEPLLRLLHGSELGMDQQQFRTDTLAQASQFGCFGEKRNPVIGVGQLSVAHHCDHPEIVLQMSPQLADDPVPPPGAVLGQIVAYLQAESAEIQTILTESDDSLLAIMGSACRKQWPGKRMIADGTAAVIRLVESANQNGFSVQIARITAPLQHGPVQAG